MSLHFSMLYRFVIAFLPKSKGLLICGFSHHPEWFWSQENKICYCFSPSICHEVMRLDAVILVFWMLNFKPAFSLSSFTFIKRLFSSSSLSAIRVVSPAYLRLLIFLTTILIPVCASSSPAFLLFHVQFHLLLLDPPIDFSRGRSGSLVFPSFEELST